MSANYPELKATVRLEKGTAASRRLRRLESRVPGEVYGTNVDNVSVSVSQHEIKKLLSVSNHASQIVALRLMRDKAEEKIICLMQVKVHDYRAEVETLDFKRIDINVPIVTKVSLKVVGKQAAPGLKNSSATLHVDMSEVEVKGLPAVIPTEILVDVSTLNVGDALHLSQIVLPQGLVLAHPVEDDMHDHAVLSIHLRKAAASEEQIDDQQEETETETDSQ